jgi:putative ABC transport system permease protein
MYLRLLAESLRRGTRRKLLAISAVALGTLGATALGEVVLASGDRLAAEMSSYGANIELVPAAGRGTLPTLPVSGLEKVRTIFWRNNIAALAPLYPLRVRFSPGGSIEVVAPLVGTWFDHALEPGFRTGLPATRPTLRVAGRWPREGAPDIALGERLARRLGVGTGGEVQAEVGGRAARFRVVGLLTSGGEEDDQAFAPLAAVEELAGQPGRFTRAEIFALTNPETRNVRDPKRMSREEYDAWYCTAYPSSVAFQIGEVLPEADRGDRRRPEAPLRGAPRPGGGGARRRGRGGHRGDDRHGPRAPPGGGAAGGDRRGAAAGGLLLPLGGGLPRPPGRPGRGLGRPCRRPSPG